MPKYWGKQIFNHGRFPEVAQKQKTEKRERKKEDQELVITMASYALQRHLGWRTQSRLGQNNAIQEPKKLKNLSSSSLTRNVQIEDYKINNTVGNKEKIGFWI